MSLIRHNTWILQNSGIITLAIKYLSKCHSGGARAGVDPVARIQVNSLDAGSVIKDLIRDLHDECFLFHCTFNTSCPLDVFVYFTQIRGQIP